MKYSESENTKTINNIKHTTQTCFTRRCVFMTEYTMDIGTSKIRKRKYFMPCLPLILLIKNFMKDKMRPILSWLLCIYRKTKRVNKTDQNIVKFIHYTLFLWEHLNFCWGWKCLFFDFFWTSDILITLLL